MILLQRVSATRTPENQEVSTIASRRVLFTARQRATRRRHDDPEAGGARAVQPLESPADGGTRGGVASARRSGDGDGDGEGERPDDWRREIGLRPADGGESNGEPRETSTTSDVDDASQGTRHRVDLVLDDSGAAAVSVAKTVFLKEPETAWSLHPPCESGQCTRLDVRIW